jgi:mannose-6-phosphate isomerase-like protein (cupin superfamily)
MQRKLVLLLLPCLFAACASQAPHDSNRPFQLPENASDIGPQNPLVELVPGLYSRPLFRTDDGPGFSVEVREMLVGPRKKSAEAALPGPAVMEVRHGQGVVTVGGKAMEVSIGTVFVVPEKTPFAVDNRHDVLELSLRVTTVMAK